MKAKYTLEARTAKTFKAMKIRKNADTKKLEPVPVEGATSYYVRFVENSKRQRVRLDSDLAEAFRLFQNYEMKGEADKRGIEVPPEVKAVIESKKKLTLTEARDVFFSDRPSLKRKTVQAYTVAINDFIESSRNKEVEDVGPQDMIDFVKWLKARPVKDRKHANPGRTQFNRVRLTAIFLKAFGKRLLLPKKDYPKFHEKKVMAHDNEELTLLYKHANYEEKFLLDFFIGSMVRNAEGYLCKYCDLTGTTLTVYGKQDKTRTVEISPLLAAAIRERRKVSRSEYIFTNSLGKPNQHLLRVLQDLAARVQAYFHVELHKLRKTGASRRLKAGVPLMVLMRELGHGSLDITQKYLADVTPDETKKSVAAADFVLPKPRIERTGTDGD